MTEAEAMDQVYGDNILLQPLGPPLKTRELPGRLSVSIPKPTPDFFQHRTACLHALETLDDLFVPCPSNMAFAISLDLMLRKGYRYRSPTLPSTWSTLYGNPRPATSPAMMLHMGGLSGTGKSRGIQRVLEGYKQTAVHAKFPGFVGPLAQLVWMKVDVPATGRLVDLALTLMMETDRALGTDLFKDVLRKGTGRGLPLFNHWLSVAKRHFLGVLVLDEIQNLFSVAPVKVRKVALRPGTAAEAPLKVKDDEALKTILTLSNMWAIPLVLSGTPDGISALTTRFSTLQRFGSCGSHTMVRTTSVDDLYYRKCLFPELNQLVYCRNPIADETAMMEKLLKVSGGIRRVMSHAWRFGQRVMLEQAGVATNQLKFEPRHLEMAANVYMKELQPAIKALDGDDIFAMRRYQDLVTQPSQ